jgi:hypothetical protein
VIESRAAPYEGFDKKYSSEGDVPSADSSVFRIGHARLYGTLSNPIKCSFLLGNGPIDPTLTTQGGDGMVSSNVLRHHASECLKLAQNVSGEGRACLVALAKRWTKDAEEIERRDALAWREERSCDGRSGPEDRINNAGVFLRKPSC